VLIAKTLQLVLIILFPDLNLVQVNRNNLIPACRRCNSNKGSSEVEEWYKRQEFFTQVQDGKNKNLDVTRSC
jgi:hypothetical protein